MAGDLASLQAQLEGAQQRLAEIEAQDLLEAQFERFQETLRTFRDALDRMASDASSVRGQLADASGRVGDVRDTLQEVLDGAHSDITRTMDELTGILDRVGGGVGEFGSRAGQLRDAIDEAQRIFEDARDIRQGLSPDATPEDAIDAFRAYLKRLQPGFDRIAAGAPGLGPLLEVWVRALRNGVEMAGHLQRGRRRWDDQFEAGGQPRIFRTTPSQAAQRQQERRELEREVERLRDELRNHPDYVNPTEEARRQLRDRRNAAHRAVRDAIDHCFSPEQQQALRDLEALIAQLDEKHIEFLAGSEGAEAELRRLLDEYNRLLQEHARGFGRAVACVEGQLAESDAFRAFPITLRVWYPYADFNRLNEILRPPFIRGIELNLERAAQRRAEAAQPDLQPEPELEPEPEETPPPSPGRMRVTLPGEDPDAPPPPRRPGVTLPGEEPEPPPVRSGGNFTFAQRSIPSSALMLTGVLVLVLLIGAVFSVALLGGPGATLPPGTLIGPDGGAVTSDDGRLTLDVPAGALDEETEISLSAVPDDARPAALEGLPLLGSYNLDARGATFSRSPSISWSMPLDDPGLDLDAGLPIPVPLLCDEHGCALISGSVFSVTGSALRVDLPPARGLGANLSLARAVGVRVGSLDDPLPLRSLDPAAETFRSLDDPAFRPPDISADEIFVFDGLTGLTVAPAEEPDASPSPLAETRFARDLQWLELDPGPRAGTRLGPFNVDLDGWLALFDRSRAPESHLRLTGADLLLGMDSEGGAAEALRAYLQADDQATAEPDDLERIVRSLDPLVWIGGDTLVRVAQPADESASSAPDDDPVPPPPADPPHVNELSVTLNIPISHYLLDVTDPAGGDLTFAWEMTGEQCGTPDVPWSVVLHPDGSVETSGEITWPAGYPPVYLATEEGTLSIVSWSHGGEPPDSCHHVGTNHDVIVVITVTSSASGFSVQCLIEGSDPVPAISDPECPAFE